MNPSALIERHFDVVVTAVCDAGADHAFATVFVVHNVSSQSVERAGVRGRCDAKDVAA